MSTRTMEVTTPETHDPLPDRLGDEPAQDEAVVDGEDGQLALVDPDTVTQPTTPVRTLQFMSGDEARVTAVALTGYAADLRALAKKSRELAREREAQSFEREAKLVHESLLAQLKPDPTLPFHEEPLHQAIARVVGYTVRHALRRSLMLKRPKLEGESDEEHAARAQEDANDFEAIVGGIAEHSAAAVSPVLEQLAERAFAAGLAARTVTPETLAREAVQAVEAERIA